jgi:TM2 domain-containing membrane protein YozV
MSSGPDLSGAENRPPQQPAWGQAPPPSLPGPPPSPQSYGLQPAAPAPQVPVAGQFQPPAPAQPAAQPMILPKNPALGVILSLFIPGVGSMVNGSAGRGVIILACYAVSWIFSLILIGIPFLIGTWIWGMVDGYLSAQRWNRAHGIIS